MGKKDRHRPRAVVREVRTMPDTASRSSMLDRAIADLLAQVPEIEAAAVVSFDGLPMASALPATMDEDRVAAMSAALLSLGERAAEGLGRGGLNQVYIEGDHGTVFLVSADDEAVLVAVAAAGAKVGMMLYEVRRAAASVASVLRAEDAEAAEVAAVDVDLPAAPVEIIEQAAPVYETTYETSYEAVAAPVDDVLSAPVSSYSGDASSSYAPAGSEPAWPSYLPNGSADATPWA
jgi:predicted regulator of Ras-like GTPase activity (Roadblock/LC7/MglB family)